MSNKTIASFALSMLAISSAFAGGPDDVYNTANNTLIFP